MTYEPATAAPVNRLGKVSFILGIALVTVGFGFSMLQAALIATSGSAAIGALSLVNILLVVPIAIAALITGILGLTRPGLPRGFAAAGTTLGAGALLNIATGLLTGVLIQALAG